MKIEKKCMLITDKTFCINNDIISTSKKNTYALNRLVTPIKLFVGVTLLFSSFAQAQEKVPHEHAPGKSHGFIVIGAAEIPEFEGAKETTIVPFIVSKFSMFGVKTVIEGPQGRIDFVKNSMWQAGPALSISTGRNTNSNSTELAALPEIDVALELGAFVGFHTPFSNMKEGAISGLISARQDITGSHDGLLITGKIEYFFAVNRRLRFGSGINTTYANTNYMDTYFSVDANSASGTGLGTFQANAGIKDIGMEIYSNLSLNKKWSLFSRFSYNRLLSDAAKSPVVDTAGSSNQYFFGAGVFYRF